jgi:threonine dehydrogenase-like Zn-dependent dehydrogenase
VGPGDRVAVIGCGAVGLGAVAAAAWKGATVYAVDVEDGKLATAQRAGAHHGINTSITPLHDALAELTGGEGPDVIIEAVGLQQTYRAAVEEVCYAGRVVYIGYTKEPVEYETRQFVLKELDIRGSRNAQQSDFAGVIELLDAGRFPTGEAITLTVPFDEAPDALRAWDANPGDYCRIQVAVGE